MSAVEFIRELERKRRGTRACLVKRGDDYFVVSSLAYAFDHGGAETLAFAADENGEILSFTDVAGGRGVSREQVIEELARKGPDPSKAGRGMFGDDKRMDERDPGEMLSTAFDVFGQIISGEAFEDPE